MRTILSLTAALFSLTVLATPLQVSPIHVSPSGNDRAAGTIKKPLRTIAGALRKAEAMDSSVRAEIFLHEGVYPQDSTLVITRGNLSVSAWPGERAIISGGAILSPRHLRKVSDADVAAAIPAERLAHIREIDFRSLGIPVEGLRPSGFGRPSIAAWTEIYVNGRPGQIARWPNDSSLLIGKIIEAGTGEHTKNAPFPVFGYNEDRPSQWKLTDNMWIGGYFAHGYADDMIRVASVDTATRTIHAAQHTVYGFMTGADWRRWHALNLPEELDVPGEYVIDPDRGKIYVYLPEGKVTDLRLSVLGEPIVAVENCADVELKNLTIEYGRQIGVYMENTEGVRVNGCVIRNMGGPGVVIGRGTLERDNVAGHQHGGGSSPRQVGDLMGRLYEDILFNRNAGKNNGVVNCHIYNVGAGGVSLGGGDRASLDPAGNYVDSCRIHDYNRIEKSYRPGVWIDGVGNRVSHCSIYNAPSMAILFHGNNHIIENCDITHVCSEVDDQGAIYYGRDASEQGNVIRYCYFHELSPRHRVTATYHDDGACGAEVYGNIYYRAGSLPVLIGGAHNNSYRNNVFIDSPVAIHIDNRMQNWGSGMVARGGIIDRRLAEVKYREEPYSTAYPLLTVYWDEDPSFPRGNLIEGNLFYKIGNVVRGRSEWLEMCNNWTTNSDPGFVDPADPMKGFRTDAPVYTRIAGFPKLPFSEIGCPWEAAERD